MKVVETVRKIGVLCLVLQLAGGPAARAAAGPGPSQPNVVVIMLDDLDRDTLSLLLSLGNTLPNFKKYILDSGTEFENSYVSNPLCCPSRSTFLSGQYSHNHRVFTNQQTSGEVVAFDDTSTLPVWLSQAGYRTVHVGKYLNGYGSMMLQPTQATANYLRDEWTKKIGAHEAVLEPSYVPPGWQEWFGLVDTTTYCTRNFTISQKLSTESRGDMISYLRNGEVVRLGADNLDSLFQAHGQMYQVAEKVPPSEIAPAPGGNYQTDVLALRAVEAINRANAETPGQPLFLAVFPLAPHVEACAWNNFAYLSAPPEVREWGPSVTWTDYKDQFKDVIRPRDDHERYVPFLTAVAKQFLEQKVATFNEADMSDKPKEFGRLAKLEDADKKAVYHQFAMRMAALLSVDQLIGKVMGALERNAMLDKTYVFFTGDNGWFYGEHRLSEKLLEYEEAARVPLFVRTPDQRKQVCPKLVVNNDLAVTIADLAGVGEGSPALIADVDGRTLAPLFVNPNPSMWRHSILSEHYRMFWPEEKLAFVDWDSAFAIRTDSTAAVPDRKYIEHYKGRQYSLRELPLGTGFYLEQPPTAALGFPDPIQSPPDGDWIWEQAAPATELYDLRYDPRESLNQLSLLPILPPADREALLQQAFWLKLKLHKLLRCRGATCHDAENESW